ncbi:MAG TPA: CHAT domain-containing protein, partial [Geminicoccus sp.]|uniref:DUF7379 domain-containing protein n=1 Tax=Geminicoccus sp. TaxID=2024832 RepID=UPI002BDC8D84
MTLVRVPGQEELLPPGEPVRGRTGEPLDRFGLSATVHQSVRVEVTRGSGDKAEVTAAEDDVVELVMDGGARLYVRGDEVIPQLRGAASRSITRSDAVELTPTLPLPTRDRGILGDWVIKGLRVLDVDLSGRSASTIANAVEDKLVGKPGLYRWQLDKSLTAVDGALPNDPKPWLVFLHGTASNTSGGFGGLAANAVLWRRLHETYPDRILALEHRTLTESPIENALQLVEQLPANAILHVVSHSRGGLVGELLARGQRTEDGKTAEAFDRDDLALLGGVDRTKQAEFLARLRDALAQKQPKVARFVRVACPARGTTLASARLDRWLNVTLNVLGFAIDAGAPFLGLTYDGLQAFLLAVIKERTDPATLPGLEAMIPGSPLMKLLNRPDVTSAADLSVIEGDCEASGVLQRLKLWFTDAYYGEDHDLVVNTSSMSGGIIRTSARRFLDRGSSVDHFRYFSNPLTAERTMAGLLRSETDPAGYSDLVAASAVPMPVLRNRGPSDRRPIVYVLPGITGSHLAAGNDRIWIDPFRLALGGLARLRIGEQGITAEGPVGLYYGELCRYLDATHEVRPWAYDWRLPIRHLGNQFAEVLRKAFRETDRPIRIVAHSMGGLVTRSAFLDSEVWRQFRERKDCRLVQLGTPNGGSYSIPFMLMGRNSLMGVLAAADLKLSRSEQHAILTAWPGAVQMLPHAGKLDFYDRTVWEQLASADPGDLAFQGPSLEDLAVAKAFRDIYATAPLDGERMFYIAGQAPTIDGILVDPSRPSGQRILFTRTNEGDGQVLWRTGIPNGIRTWYTPAAHGDLARHEPAFAAISDLLETGTTVRLPTDPRTLTRGRGEPSPIVREEPPIQPRAEDVVAAALGGAAGTVVERTVVPKITIRVVHGNLALARYPVMVGHYPGDSLNGAEAVLNRALDGRLQERRRMGLYPGDIATSTVVLDPDKRPKGAVVVGLGEPGSLAMGTLQHTLRQGLLAYAAAEADRRRSNKDTTSTSASLSTVLIGAGDGGLGRGACALALLRAAARAQSVLTLPPEEPSDQPPLLLGEIEILELFEYRALEIWHVVDAALKQYTELNKHFTLHPEVVRQGGARRRLIGGEDDDWWLPVQITMEPPAPGLDKVLRYTVAGGLARAESQLVGTNLDVVRSLLRRSIESGQTYGGSVSPARALFELLWPVRLKEFSEDDRNLRLILDEDSARFPWELMDDRRPWTSDGRLPDSGNREPAAVRSGVVRQLVQTRFREYVATSRGSRKALVIGDPRGRPESGFAELPGARREAEAVADLLARTHDVTPLIGDDVLPEHVVMHLFAEAWEVIHIAAHGVVREPIAQKDGAKPELTGVVLGGGVVLGPSILAQLSVSPELFFLNCCHLGHVDPDAEKEARVLSARGQRPELAASVAVELIKNGVRGVVAAGWAVDDDAAEQFAITFYQRMLEGDEFGSATQKARHKAYEVSPTGTTWGAYQCYGEPDMRLPGMAQTAREETSKSYAGVAEVIALAEQITEDINVGLERDEALLRRRLVELEDEARRRSWFGNAELRVAFAEARAELGDLAQAIQHYEEASKGSDTKFKVKAIEQLANLAARSATRVYRSAGPVKPDVSQTVRVIERARARVEGLEQVLGPTAERAILRGGSWKRLAQVQTGDARQQALLEMEKAYEEAVCLSPGNAKDYP